MRSITKMLLEYQKNLHRSVAPTIVANTPMDGANDSSSAKSRNRGRLGIIIIAVLLLAAAAVALLQRDELPPPPPEASVPVKLSMLVGTQPGQSVSGNPVVPPPSVLITDDAGRPSRNQPVSVRVEPGDFVEGSEVEVVTDSEGRAVFDALVLAKAGAYRLAFSAPGCEPASSASFVVRFGPPRKMSIVAEPGDGIAGSVLAGNPSVLVADLAGNPVPGVDVDVSLAPGVAGTLGGRTTVPTDAQGLAVFDDLVITETGSDYRLDFTARATGVNGVTSAPFALTNS